MKIRGKKIVSLGLATMITVSTFSASAFANTSTGFKDVPSNHWAKPVIEKVSKEGLFTGYEGNIFKPQESISRSQVIVLLSRLLGLSQSEIQQAKTKYDSVLNKAFVPEWAKGGVASALARGIISESEANTLFNKDESQPKAIRSEVCKYITRTLGLESEAKSKTTFNLPFKDSEKIKKDDIPYVNIMVEKKIINGDNTGNFNPNNNLTRAEMAKVLSLANDYKKSMIPTPVVTTQVKGTIYTINNAVNSDQIFLTIRDSGYNLIGYTIDSKTKFYIDSKTTNISDFVKDMEVTLDVTTDKKVVNMKTVSITEDYKGTVYEVSASEPSSITIEYKANKNDSNTTRKTFKVDSNAKIKIDGKTGYLKDIKKGDAIDISVVNTRITEIDVDSKNKEIEGILKEIDYKKDTILTIKGDDKETYDYKLNSKATIKRNRKTAKIEDLKRGDEVEIKVEDDEIIEIYAESVDTEDKGTITGMNNTTNGMKITISNSDKEENSYYLPKSTKVYIDKTRKEVLDLKLGYYVELEIEGEEIVSVEAKSVNASESLTGTIDHINKKAEIVTVIVVEGGSKKEVQISLSDSNIMDGKGNTVRFSGLEEGDTIMVTGDYDGPILNATVAILLSYSK